MENIKKNNKTKKAKKDNFEIIFISISIFMFLLLIFSIQWLKGSLYQAKDEVAVEFLNDYDDNLIIESGDPLVGAKNSLNSEDLETPIDTGLDPSLGSSDAKVRIFYFSDFSCPFCLEQEEIIKRVYDKFSQDVRVVWKDYPDLNSLEDFSYQAARAARCANEQGKFWDYNKMLYNQEESFTTLKSQLFLNLAENLKLNINNFTNCLTNVNIDNAIMENISEAEDLGIVGIPYIYINDKDMLGDFSEEELELIIESELDK
jgi:protein-disulfide isomerase